MTTTTQKITQWNSKLCNLVSKEIAESLSEIEEKYGVVITAKGGSYSHSAYTMKLEVATTSSDGEANTKEASDFKMYALAYGFKQEHLNEEVIVNGSKVIIKGLKPRSHKYPVIGEKNNGERYKYTAETIKNALRIKGVL